MNKCNLFQLLFLAKKKGEPETGYYIFAQPPSYAIENESSLRIRQEKKALYDT